jgi:superfamily II DNA or RNA helicase
VCSIQTLGVRQVFPEADVVIVDECHLQFEAIREWMRACPKVAFIGLSATPWARGMGDWYDDLVKPSSMRALIESKRLSKLCAFAPDRLDLRDVKVVDDDYHQGELSAKMRGKKIVADVVRTWCDLGGNRPTLVFAVDRAHAQVLADRFSSVGVPTAYIDGETEMADRKTIIDGFNRGEVRVITSIGTMNAGIDLDVRCVTFARPTKSEILYVQSVGRGMRWKPDKDHLLLLDHSNCSVEMGLPMDIRFERLLPGRAKNAVERALGERTVRKPLECPKCKRLAEGGAKQCEGCGHVFKATTNVKELEGRLRAMSLATAEQADKKRLNKEWTVEERAAFHGELKTVCLAKGHKPGWAAFRYKERFGCWPDYGPIRRAPERPVTPETAGWLWRQDIARRKAYAKQLAAQKAAEQ